MFTEYRPKKGYDEYFSAAEGPRSGLKPLVNSLGALGIEKLNRNHAAAGVLLKRLGATFRLNDSGGRVGERILPFDPLPRLIRSKEWERLERGLSQRLEAIDQFLGDIYGEQRIIRDGVIPREHVESSLGWRRELQGFKPPLGKWCQISGLDLIRDGEGTWRVLEDNLRCPSGVAYFLENRRVMKRMFPSLFSGRVVQPIDRYPSQLLQTLRELAPWTDSPRVVLLTPGVFNSAYFEHSYLAQQMGIPLVEGRDLACEDGRVWMRTTRGLETVDVIYRRIDDDFLDPAVFRSDSMLGVRGLMEVYAQGRVAIANAPGTGIADDKLIYAYVPEMVRYYLGEEAIIQNVPTYLCSKAEDRSYVLSHLRELVVKAVSEAGGYGMLIGPHASDEEIQDFATKIEANPRNFIAQPT
ncbi:MAG: circularly permuted type 2 ATP-grasp protein, partial [Vulcanococcus sp.]